MTVINYALGIAKSRVGKFRLNPSFVTLRVSPGSCRSLISNIHSPLSQSSLSDFRINRHWTRYLHDRIVFLDQYDVDAEAIECRMGRWRRKSGVENLIYSAFRAAAPFSFRTFCSSFIQYCFSFRIMIRHAFRRQLANITSFSHIGRRYAHAPSVFNWEDPLDSTSLFTEEESAIQASAHSYCQDRMLPRVLGSQGLPIYSKAVH